jgi:hypothetical protein
VAVKFSLWMTANMRDRLAQAARTRCQRTQEFARELLELGLAETGFPVYKTKQPVAVGEKSKKVLQALSHCPQTFKLKDVLPFVPDVNPDTVSKTLLNFRDRGILDLVERGRPGKLHHYKKRN